MPRGEWQRGRTLPQSTKDKIRNTLKGRMAGSNNPMFGRTHSAETKKKMGEKHLGFRHSEETRLRMRTSHKKIGTKPPVHRGSDHPMYGKPRPQEVKDKIRRSLGGKMAGSGNPRYGVKLSQETKDKIRKTQLGKKLHHDHIEKIRQGNKGKVRTVDVRRKFSKIRRGPLSRLWKGGVTPLQHLIRQSLKYRQWRKDVFDRDDYTCTQCGSRGNKIEADHYPVRFATIFHSNNIKSLDEADACSSLWDINNGRTLCYECHHEKTNLKGDRRPTVKNEILNVCTQQISTKS
jgi:5-methylcytosine-specific restriction endonuclease McrA